MLFEYGPDDFCAIAAVNDEAILAECLAKSPDIAQGRLPLTEIRNAPSMSSAYNQGLEQTTAAICLLVHQDVYLPNGWLDKAIDLLNELSVMRPEWMVAGPYGVADDGEHVGCVWDANMQRELGQKKFAPRMVGSLDELLLILRRPDGFRFDADLPHFHLYGTDLVQSARAAGRSTFAVDLPVVHNNRPWHTLGGGYLDAYRYTRRKWRKKLPIHTTICSITYNPLPLLRTRWRRRHVDRREDYVLADARELARLAGYE
ncbi:MAG: glycosyltransferase [Pseudomonadota bacterium]